jgi:hypothetical protein
MSTPHPFLTQPGESWAEQASDALPRQSGLVAMSDGSMTHYAPPGSLHEQLGLDSPVLHAPLPTGTSEGTEATSNQQKWGSMGAANEPVNGNKPGV